MNSEQWGKKYGDVWEDRELILQSLLDITYRDDIQVVVKLHPMSSAVYKKKGETKDIEGITLTYLKEPKENFIVVDGKKETRRVARDILYACDYIVGCNSTMMVEGAIIGKPVLRTRMNVSKNILHYPGYDDIFTQSRGYFNTCDRTLEMVDKDGRGFMMKDTGDDYLIQDTDSCGRICEAIKKET
jgi:hypothetical protein